MSVRHDVAQYIKPDRCGGSPSCWAGEGRHPSKPDWSSAFIIGNMWLKFGSLSFSVETVTSSCLGDDLEFSALGLFGFFEHRETFAKNVAMFYRIILKFTSIEVGDTPSALCFIVNIAEVSEGDSGMKINSRRNASRQYFQR